MKAGDIYPDGEIHTDWNGPTSSGAIVWVEKSRLAEYEAHGWKSVGGVDHNHLIQVRRSPT